MEGQPDLRKCSTNRETHVSPDQLAVLFPCVTRSHRCQEALGAPPCSLAVSVFVVSCPCESDVEQPHPIFPWGFSTLPMWGASRAIDYWAISSFDDGVGWQEAQFLPLLPGTQFTCCPWCSSLGHLSGRVLQGVGGPQHSVHAELLPEARGLTPLLWEHTYVNHFSP